MRRGIEKLGVVVALAVLVTVPVACGDTGEAEPNEVAAGAESEAPTQSVLPEPACEPSDRMDVAGRTSPYDSATIAVGEGVAKVCYGRPSLRGRTMIGGDAVPYDTLWRTGANEPTIIHVNVPARIGGLDVEPGAYSLYTIPREGEEWTLIVNGATEQWGHESSYTEEVRAEEIGRVDVPAETLDSRVDQLTIRPVDRSADGTDAATQEPGLLLEWQETRVHIPITPVD